MESPRSGGSPGTVASPPAEAGSGPEAQDGPVRSFDELRSRRDGGEALPAATSPIVAPRIRLRGADLAGLDLSGADLSDAELLDCDLGGSRLIGADLSGAVLRNADLSGAELLGADLSGADLTDARLERAGLGQTRAAHAILFGARAAGATFSAADLTAADLRKADLSGCRMREVDLAQAAVSAADLSEVDLTGANVSKASFRSSSLRSALLRNLTGYRKADWIEVDLRGVDFAGAWQLRRHIHDENFIEEFRAQSRMHEVLYQIWYVTSDCGRSLFRWTVWTFLVAMTYAGLYNLVEIDWGENPTALSPVYYSVVTFTTLGYGDITPGSTAAQLLAMSEVVLGYFSLGGMMSILSDKMARRAG